ncbi:ATPase, T2SS/T4P/T4SS family [Agrobacterium sp. GD03638]|jgi:defect-in-organelle-trafficking protein DotB|uniref:type IV pilus twitching motility protein PilT n=2 Tax=Rhizobium/Agrobacterium group TaxID=227290 RepID=UPI0024485CD3|nr:ATPase, T2SS/T4P/T4SS family [Agrobacterium sp. GD03638]MCW5796354.1 Flp pilus assembly complex ATPase component TadA [Nitrospira sp.]MDH2221591.1 ATPase, T2SS/T4P/T4SS family [Agrobacterium sp. GD03638]
MMDTRVGEASIGLWTGRRDLSQNFGMTESGEDVMKVLCYAARSGCQDVIFQTGAPILMNQLGSLVALTEWTYDTTDFMRAAKHISGSGGDVETRLAGGRAFNKRIDARDFSERDEYGEPRVYRFRANVTACAYGAALGGQMVLRYIPEHPPTVKDIGLEEDIIGESTPEMGSVILSGPTGSGKTTTFAALLRRVMEEETAIEGNVVTLEQPIEFSFDSIKSHRCVIAQSEIPTHFSSFEMGIEEAMRRVPRLIVVGEQRDYQTMAAAQEAANTGHAVYTTVHSNTSSLAIQRIVGKFPREMQSQAFEMAVATTHMIVSQVLVRNTSGGRVCLREWVVLDDDARQELTKVGFLGSRAFLYDLMCRGGHGKPMKATVAEQFKSGNISEDAARLALKRYGYSRSERII